MTLTSAIDLFSAWVEAQMAYRGLPGLAVGVVHRQEVVWAQGFGFADLARQSPATPQTIYRIASITKLFTATAVLQLRDAGKLQLDDPVHKHLPWFVIQNAHEDTPVITIRHLLTHTAGLPREADFPYWIDQHFPTLAQIEATINQQHTAVPTGTRWKYSNLGLALAGAIVAQASGQPYETYIQEQILRPLAMANTFVQTIARNHEQLAVGYGRRLPGRLERDVMPFTDAQGLTPAANMATTVQDLARFACFQFGDGTAGDRRILRQSSLQEMQRIHWLEPGWQAGWGLGFRILRQGDKTTIGHGGAVLGYRTLIHLRPQDKIGVIVLTNADDGDPLAFADKAFNWIAPAVLQAAAPEPEAKTADPAWAGYLGKYRTAWGDVQIVVQNGELTAIDPSLPDPLLAIIRLAPLAEHTFRMETENGFLSPGETAVFHLDTAGKVIALQTGQITWARLERW